MERVVITGMGIVSPLGNDVDTFWQGLKEGRSGISQIERFDVTDFSTKIAGQVRGFDGEAIFGRKEARKMDLFCQYALFAAEQAVQDADLNPELIDRERFGVYVGSGIGGIETLAENVKVLENRGPNRVSPSLVPMMISNMAAAQISIRFGALGETLSPVTACSIGNSSIGEAFRLIRSGEADVMIAGGTEAAVHPLALASFGNATALSKRNEAPEQASRPFDADRDGFVMGEGAYLAMRRALVSAGITPEQVDVISAHATSTPVGDLGETKGIKKAFGKYAHRIPITANKSMTGHMFGAAGGAEAIALVQTLKEGIIPPTINLMNPDPECDLDYVPNEARRAELKIGLSNSFGFGGHNAVIVVRKYEE